MSEPAPEPEMLDPEPVWKEKGFESVYRLNSLRLSFWCINSCVCPRKKNEMKSNLHFTSSTLKLLLSFSHALWTWTVDCRYRWWMECLLNNARQCLSFLHWPFLALLGASGLWFSGSPTVVRTDSWQVYESRKSLWKTHIHTCTRTQTRTIHTTHHTCTYYTQTHFAFVWGLKVQLLRTSLSTVVGRATLLRLLLYNSSCRFIPCLSNPSALK